jgi:hypothetical protein
MDQSEMMGRVWELAVFTLLGALFWPRASKVNESALIRSTVLLSLRQNKENLFWYIAILRLYM